MITINNEVEKGIMYKSAQALEDDDKFKPLLKKLKNNKKILKNDFLTTSFDEEKNIFDLYNEKNPFHKLQASIKLDQIVEMKRYYLKNIDQKTSVYQLIHSFREFDQSEHQEILLAYLKSVLVIKLKMLLNQCLLLIILKMLFVNYFMILINMISMKLNILKWLYFI